MAPAALIDAARLRDELDDPSLRVLDATAILRREVRQRTVCRRERTTGL